MTPTQKSLIKEYDRQDAHYALGSHDLARRYKVSFVNLWSVNIETTIRFKAGDSLDTY